MGLDVMSRSVRVRYAMSSSPSPAARHKSLDPDRSMSDGPFHKSLTPNRKHHKLLKDGSEVWSEEVERVFVEGTLRGALACTDPALRARDPAL